MVIAPSPQLELPVKNTIEAHTKAPIDEILDKFVRHVETIAR